MPKRVIDSSGKDELPVKQRRNTGVGESTQVYGISASKGFWREIDRRMVETGQGRSAVIVEALTEYWKLVGIETRRCGRPRKKKVKGRP